MFNFSPKPYQIILQLKLYPLNKLLLTIGKNRDSWKNKLAILHIAQCITVTIMKARIGYFEKKIR